MSSIFQVIEAVILSFFKYEQLDPQSVILLVDFIMENIPQQLDLSTLSNFMQSQTILPTMVRNIGELVFTERQNSARLLQQVSKNSVLTPAALCLVYANLPEELKDRWKLLFSRFDATNLIRLKMKNAKSQFPISCGDKNFVNFTNYRLHIVFRDNHPLPVVLSVEETFDLVHFNRR